METFDLVVVGVGEIDDGFAVFGGGGDVLDVLEADTVPLGIDVAEVEETAADEATDTVFGGGDATDGTCLAVGDVEHAIEFGDALGLGERCLGEGTVVDRFDAGAGRWAGEAADGVVR